MTCKEIPAKAFDKAEAFQRRAGRSDRRDVPPYNPGFGYYDRCGIAISFYLWAVLFEDANYKIVAKEVGLYGQEASTVWLGSDHSWGSGPPLIFETMIFGGPWDQEYCTRCSTEDEAWKMHRKAVRKVWNPFFALRGHLRWVRRFAETEYPAQIIEEYKREVLEDPEAIARQQRYWKRARGF